MNDNLKKNWKCPHPFCCHQTAPMTKAEIRSHYIENHKCGRCNAGRHHKCKFVLCGCSVCFTKPAIDGTIRLLEEKRTERKWEERRASLLGKVS